MSVHTCVSHAYAVRMFESPTAMGTCATIYQFNKEYTLESEDRITGVLRSVHSHHPLPSCIELSQRRALQLPTSVQFCMVLIIEECTCQRFQYHLQLCPGDPNDVSSKRQENEIETANQRDMKRRNSPP